MDESSVTNLEDPSDEKENPNALEEHLPQKIQQEKSLADLARATDTEPFVEACRDKAKAILAATLPIRQTFGNRQHAEDAQQDALEFLLRKGRYQKLIVENPGQLRYELHWKGSRKAIDNYRKMKRQKSQSLDNLASVGFDPPAAFVDFDETMTANSIIGELAALGLNEDGLRVFIKRLFDPGSTMSPADRKRLQRLKEALLLSLGVSAEELETIKLIRFWQYDAGWNTPTTAALDFVRCAAGQSTLPTTVKERPTVPTWLIGLDIDGQTRALVDAFTSGISKLGALWRTIDPSNPENSEESEA